ncbi:hypothetical protein C5167_029293 [Papaver somniferum]|nr:hypothetical protein C5167_029293 [Papaver somniferum]
MLLSRVSWQEFEADPRDAYGFSVRPQHLQRYREYANIYKEEEEERSERWKDFLDRQAEPAQLPINGLHKEEETTSSHADDTVPEEETVVKKGVEEDDSNETNSVSDGSINEEVAEETKADTETETDKKSRVVQIWSQIRPSLGAIEQMMSLRVKKRKNLSKGESGNHLASIEEGKSSKGSSGEDSDDEFYDVERSDPVQDASSADNASAPGAGNDADFPWKEELECLVQGGVPMALRGELWQAFVGAKARRGETYYQDLLARDASVIKDNESDGPLSHNISSTGHACPPEKWKGQIEKAMNFFAGLLLLLMPEENAFWTLMGIIDDYFDGYFSEEMIESQVDQLVFEDLVRERFPKLVNHLDYLGVQVAWVTGPWFLSIFVNMLPWESVLRVWDVLLFEGNRIMLFRTALAIMELYGTGAYLDHMSYCDENFIGPALVTTKDAGDAVTLLQSLAGSTFDSSQLVLTACMGFQFVNEVRLQELREKHRPSVVAAVEERAKGLRIWKNSQGLASKLYSFKHDPESLITESSATEVLLDTQTNGCLESGSNNLDELSNGLTEDSAEESVPDLQEQVVWLKVELCKLLEEKRSAVLRAEELETALMEMVKQDNRRQLSARVELLEQEVAELRQALTDKQEQERAMLQVLMRVEQDQKVTEDARRFAEQDAAAQRYAATVLQEKYEEAQALLAQMEKRAVMAESMLEATLQYQSGQVKAQQSPRAVAADSAVAKLNQDSPRELPARKISLLSRPFGLGWRGNKGKPVEESKPTPVEESNGSNPSIEEEQSISAQPKDVNMQPVASDEK